MTTDRIQILRARAASLRSQAAQLNEVVALTYRRRAQELELEAFLLEQAPADTVDDAVSAAV